MASLAAGLVLVGCGGSGPSTSPDAAWSSNLRVRANGSPAVATGSVVALLPHVLGNGPVVASMRVGTTRVVLMRMPVTGAQPEVLCLIGPGGGRGCGLASDLDRHGSMLVGGDSAGRLSIAGYAPKGTERVLLDGRPLATWERLFAAWVPRTAHSVTFITTSGTRDFEVAAP